MFQINDVVLYGGAEWIIVDSEIDEADDAICIILGDAHYTDEQLDRGECCPEIVVKDILSLVLLRKWNGSEHVDVASNKAAA